MKDSTDREESYAKSTEPAAGTGERMLPGNPSSPSGIFEKPYADPTGDGRCSRAVQGLWRPDPLKAAGSAAGAGDVCLRSKRPAGHLSVGGVPSAAAAQNQPSGQKPSRGQVGLLFVGRRPCSDHFGAGNGARPPLRRADRNFFGKKVDNFKNLW